VFEPSSSALLLFAYACSSKIFLVTLFVVVHVKKSVSDFILSSRNPQCILEYYKISQEVLQRLTTPAYTRGTTMDYYIWKHHISVWQQYREWRTIVVMSSQCGALWCRDRWIGLVSIRWRPIPSRELTIHCRSVVHFLLFIEVSWLSLYLEGQKQRIPQPWNEIECLFSTAMHMQTVHQRQTYFNNITLLHSAMEDCDFGMQSALVWERR
jgi:hypothetical protein